MANSASPISAKRAVAFIDGQNLFFAAFEAFGYTFPNYDPIALAKTICGRQSWDLAEVRLYTGIPDRIEDPLWHHFWSAKKTALTRQGAYVFTRPLRYREKKMPLKKCGIRLPDDSFMPPGSWFVDWQGREIPTDSEIVMRVGEEKGIDIRIALDVIELARNDKYDVALIFSQDQDLSEVVDEVLALAKNQSRTIILASAFPEGACNRRGINRTDWIRIDKATYDACIDARDYRKKK